MGPSTTKKRKTKKDTKTREKAKSKGERAREERRRRDGKVNLQALWMARFWNRRPGNSFFGWEEKERKKKSRGDETERERDGPFIWLRTE